MAEIIPIASGKGGTGKTLFITNLGVSLAMMGKKVILIDLDLGGANLHTCLGVKNNLPGIGNLIYKQESKLSHIIADTSIQNLYFIPGDSLLPATANLEFFIKKKLLKEIKELNADYVLLDLSAGTSYNVIDFYLMSTSGIIVTTPETTSVLNAYLLLKTVLFRLLFRSFPANSRERTIIKDFVINKIEASSLSFTHLVNIIKDSNLSSAEIIQKGIQSFYPKIVLNMLRSQNEVNTGTMLRQIINKNLGINIEFIGFIFREENIFKSIMNRRPYYCDYPTSPYSVSIFQIAQKIINYSSNPNPVLFEDNEDLWELARSAK